MPVTLRDIARRANVSHATVSVVLNQRSVPIISERTRQKVLKVAEELGYQPNHLARALATGRSHIIAAWVVEPYSPYAASTLDYLQHLVRREAFDLMVVETGRQDQAEADPARSHWPVDGIIAIDCPWRVQAALNGAHRQKTPIMSLGSVYSASADFVGIDVGSGARDAIGHLVAAGRGRIALLSPQPAASLADPIGAAYAGALAERDLQPEYIAAAPSRNAGYDAVLRRLDQGELPDAILAYNDLLAVGALKALRDRHIAVPQNTALISCSNTEELEYQEPPITVIEHPVQAMCDLGWRFLQQRLSAPEIALQAATLKPQLVIRSSSAV